MVAMTVFDVLCGTPWQQWLCLALAYASVSYLHGIALAALEDWRS